VQSRSLKFRRQNFRIRAEEGKNFVLSEFSTLNSEVLNHITICIKKINKVDIQQKEEFMKISLKLFAAVLLAGGIALGISAQEAGKKEITGTVKANKLNIRVKPGQNFTSVGSLKRGENVSIIQCQGSWYEIVAPKDVAVWVAADAVADGKLSKATELRGGPGVEHQSYMQGTAGQEVKVLESNRKLWVKIAPPENATVWVSKTYIDVPRADYGRIPGNQDATASSDKPASKPNPKTPVSSLPYVAGTAKNVTVSGVLQPVGPGAVVTHALCKSFTDLNAQSYLLGNKSELKKYEGKEVSIRGTQRHVRGWSIPVIEVESVMVK